MIELYLRQIQVPNPHSHKGENGKSLVIGGSDLFQAASQWSFLVISRFVDMAFYSSVAQNNEILLESKHVMTDGVVVKRSDLPEYFKEVTSVLIGPGMRRDFRTRFSALQLDRLLPADLNELDWEFDTQAVTSALLRAYPQKQWIVDAGALQVVDPKWLPPGAILTPHRHELQDLTTRLGEKSADFSLSETLVEIQQTIAKEYWQSAASQPAQLLTKEQINHFIPKQVLSRLYDISTQLNQACCIVKGQADIIWNAEDVVIVVGGNAGLTKGGTGDVLAGLITGFAAKSPALASSVVASYLNKAAGHSLYERQAAMFNTSDLVAEIPKVWKTLQSQIC